MDSGAQSIADCIESNATYDEEQLRVNLSGSLKGLAALVAAAGPFLLGDRLLVAFGGELVDSFYAVGPPREEGDSEAAERKRQEAGEGNGGESVEEAREVHTCGCHCPRRTGVRTS